MKFKSITSNHGFTLAELLVATALSGLVMTSIYTVYSSQQKSYTLHEQVIGMQQNLRAAMFYMAKEIRMAGCDPTGNAEAGMVTADHDFIRFTADIHDGVDNDLDTKIDEDGEVGNVDGDTNDINEDIRYYLHNGNLARNSDDVIIAENVDALNFVYLDEDGNVTANISQIRSVQIAIVVKTEKGDPGFTDNATYYNKQGDEILSPQNDNFRRKLLMNQIRGRNL